MVTYTTPDGIPYVPSTQRGNAADVPVLSEDQALKIQAALVSRAAAADANSAEMVPVGTIVLFGGRIAPTGWHACDGTAHNSSRLTTVLTGNGQVNPNLTPNLVDKFVVGTKPTGSPTASIYNVSDSAGLNSVTLTGPQSGTPVHSHTASSGNQDANHTHSGVSGAANTNKTHTHTAGWKEGVSLSGVDGNFIDSVREDAKSTKYQLAVTAANTDHTHNFTTGNQLANHGHSVTVNNAVAANATASHENRPPYYALIYIIRKGPNGT